MAAGSVFAGLQAAGAVGLGAAAKVVGGAVGVYVAYGISLFKSQTRYIGMDHNS